MVLANRFDEIFGQRFVVADVPELLAVPFDAQQRDAQRVGVDEVEVDQPDPLEKVVPEALDARQLLVELEVLVVAVFAKERHERREVRAQVLAPEVDEQIPVVQAGLGRGAQFWPLDAYCKRAFWIRRDPFFAEKSSESASAA